MFYYYYVVVRYEGTKTRMTMSGEVGLDKPVTHLSDVEVLEEALMRPILRMAQGIEVIRSSEVVFYSLLRTEVEGGTIDGRT